MCREVLLFKIFFWKKKETNKNPRSHHKWYIRIHCTDTTTCALSKLLKISNFWKKKSKKLLVLHFTKVRIPYMVTVRSPIFTKVFRYIWTPSSDNILAIFYKTFRSIHNIGMKKFSHLMKTENIKLNEETIMVSKEDAVNKNIEFQYFFCMRFTTVML